jgi:hypothetical protein
MHDLLKGVTVPLNRRSFMKKGALAAGAVTMGAGLLTDLPAYAEGSTQQRSGALP